MTRHADGTGGAPPQDAAEDRPFAPREGITAGTAADEAEPEKAEQEKAKTEIEAGDVADELADFA